MAELKLQSFSHDGQFFAISQQNGILKIWNTTSNVLIHEFQPSKHLTSTTTCLCFSKSKNKKPKRKRRSSQGSFNENANLIALGTRSGSVLIYNLALQEVIANLTHSSGSSVIDLAWEDDKVLLSLASDKTLCYWNILTSKKLRCVSVSKSSSFSILNENSLVIGKSGIKLVEVGAESISTLSHFTGHKNKIISLLPILFENESEARYFLSAGEDELYIHAWSTTGDSKDPIASFSVNDSVKNLSIVTLDQSSIGVIAVTSKGLLHYFTHHMNGTNSKKPIKSMKTIEIQCDKEEVSIPIIAAHFLSKDLFILVYGNELFLGIEKISLNSVQTHSCLKRSDPSHFSKEKQKKLLNTVTPVSEDAVHINPTGFFEEAEQEARPKRKRGSATLHLPMEDRLNALSIDKPSFPEKGSLVSNNVHLLVQALHSKDEKLLNGVIMKGTDNEFVLNTIKRLPVQSIVPLLEYLQTLMKIGLRSNACINWIKAILQHHMSHLSTLPNKETLINPFKAMSNARLEAFPEIVKLHSRLNLLLTHVANRHDHLATKQMEQDALITYREDSEEEEVEGRIDTTVLCSESEDFADPWSEDDEESKSLTEGTTGLSGSDEAQTLSKQRRSSVNEDDCNVISDSDMDDNDDIPEDDLIMDVEGSNSDD